jgi:phenylalanyl-tRNA synthetase beta chain
MRLSINWLRDYVDIDVSPQELADALTMAGLEVETLEKRYAPLDRVVVAKVLNVERHPNADRLFLCEVTDGSKEYRIVCGAPNTVAGMLAPLALEGAKLPTGMKVKKSKVRGVASEGMLCAEDELGLSEDHTGLLVLDQNLTPGMDLYEALHLDDYILEIGITPNRSDCLSVLGIARETAAILGKKLHFPHFHVQEALGPIEAETSVTIESPDGCPRYAARLMADIKIGPSPYWLREKVIAAGMRPISNVVDITNFVLMEVGQPLHAFDFDLLEEHRIVVRYAEEGDRFTTLDDVERILPAKSLMICDGKRPVALAGVMGGMNSEIQADTTRVLLESAFFDPATVRRTSKNLGLSTEASFRFERGADPDGVLFAADRAAQLMVDLAGAKMFKGAVDEYPRPIPRPSINTNTENINRFLGSCNSTEEIVDCLRAIDLEVDVDQAGEITVVPPSFRMDLTREVDLFEEVARLRGYDAIPVTMPGGRPLGLKKDFGQKMRDRARETAAAMGFLEIVTYSFISASGCDMLNLDQDDPRRDSVALINPLTEDQAVMRTTLFPGLLQTAVRNFAHKNEDLKLCELGKVFFKKPDRDLPDEVYMLSGLWTGRREIPSWHGASGKVDFFDIKGAVEGFLEGLGLAGGSFEPLSGDPVFTPGMSARLLLDGEPVGVLGLINREVLRTFDLNEPVFGFDLNFDAMMARIDLSKTVRSLPRYPSVVRDLVVVVDAGTAAGTILNLITDFCRNRFMESVGLFDVYEGDQIGGGKVSLGYRIVYRSSSRSLTDKEVNKFHEKLIAHVLKETGGSLRP